jgi:serine/threonine-protein kinase
MRHSKSDKRGRGSSQRALAGNRQSSRAPADQEEKRRGSEGEEETHSNRADQTSGDSFLCAISRSRSRVPKQIDGWGRYRDLELIGQGATSRVYRAYDPKLERLVALKLLVGDDLAQTQSLREARSQARLEHEYVCKVYDADTVGDEPYIAMQLVEGESLEKAHKNLSREEIVRVISDIALAVHAAHGQDLIHRDIKPKNIMIEERREGRWHPYILDFGLARQVDAGEHSTTGMVAGTPPFMSPEQAQGLSTIDWRTDIYSLGCTLYTLLTGKNQFTGCNGVELLLKIAGEDIPDRPRQIDPTLPVDLEAIILQCMEKEPRRRYSSARALAKDLRRFLAGRPIAARRHHLGYRLFKTIRRQRIATAAVLVTILTLGGAVASSVHSQLRAREQTEAAKRLGQEVEEMEQTMRFAAMLPLHDTQPEQQLVRQRMLQIEESLQGQGLDHELADYALGCGYLALGDNEAAYRHLERAWKGGYRSSELEHALGCAMGALYQAALADTRFFNQELRQARIAELGKRYKRPALAHLRAGASTGHPTTIYVNGLIALYEERYDDALDAASTAYAELPWLYEAKRLEGDVYYMMSSQAHQYGQYDAALAACLQAGECYAAALSIAGSDGELYLAEAWRLVLLMTLHSQRGKTPTDDLQRALTACNNALLVSPDWSEAFGARALTYLAQAEHQSLHGLDPIRALESAALDAALAVEHAPQDPEWRLLHGRARSLLAEHLHGQGADPTSALQAATASFDQAIRLDDLYADAHANRGVAQWALARYQMEHGSDPVPTLEQASSSLRRATELSTETAALAINLGNIYRTRAVFAMRRGNDPEPWLEQTETSYRQAIKLNPEDTRAHNNLGNVLQLKAESAIASGRDPAQLLSAAIASYRASMALDPNLLGPYNNLAIVLQTRGQHEMTNGIDPSATFAQALVTLDSLLQRAPGLLPALYNRGLVLAGRGRYKLMIGDNPGPDLDAAVGCLQNALTADPGDPETMALLAGTHLAMAEHAQTRGDPAGASLAAAERLLRQASTIDPDLCDIHLLTGQAAILLARNKRGEQQRLAAIEQARSALAQTALCDPSLATAHLELARADYWHAHWSTPSSQERAAACSSGIDAAGRALDLNPGMAEALALRGTLKLMLAGSAADSDADRLSSEGAADLRKAISRNSFLSHRWGSSQ